MNIKETIALAILAEANKSFKLVIQRRSKDEPVAKATTTGLDSKRVITPRGVYKNTGFGVQAGAPKSVMVGKNL